MIARDIIVSFCIFSLLKYHRIFVKNFELDIGKLKSLTQQFVGEGGGECVPCFVPEIYVSFHVA